MGAWHRAAIVSIHKFVILGAGAMGSILGAHLTRAGRDVTMLARGRRARQIATDGLRLTGLVELSVPTRVIEDPAQLRSADVLIVATKAIDTPESLALLRNAQIGIAFSVQNGVVKNDFLAAAFGREHTLGALANISGELQNDGKVLFTRNVNVAIGELAGGTSSRAGAIAQTIEASGVHCIAVSDIQSREWSKFAAWVGLAGVAMSARTYTWQFLMDRDGATAFVRLVREIGRLADASGVALTDDSVLPVATLCRADESTAVRIVQDYGKELRDSAPQHKLSTLQDIEAGRPLEMEETFGFAVRKAKELQLSLPLTEQSYRSFRPPPT